MRHEPDDGLEAYQRVAATVFNRLAYDDLVRRIVDKVRELEAMELRAHEHARDAVRAQRPQRGYNDTAARLSFASSVLRSVLGAQFEELPSGLGRGAHQQRHGIRGLHADSAIHDELVTGDPDRGLPGKATDGGVEPDDPRWHWYRQAEGSRREVRALLTEGERRAEFYQYVQELAECFSRPGPLDVSTALTYALEEFAERYNLDDERTPNRPGQSPPGVL